MAGTMTVDQAIAKAFLHAQRKPVAPTTGTTKYLALLQIADSMQKMWAAEPGVDWDSLYQLVTLSVPVSTTDTFALDSGINDISQREGNFILVSNGTQTTEFTLVSPSELYEQRYADAVAKIGQTLKFSNPFLATDPLLGGSIKVPCENFVADITTGSQTVQVDDPMWLVFMMAAEFCRNDVVKQNQYQNLLNMADQHMQKMKEANGSQYDTVATPWQPAGQSW